MGDLALALVQVLHLQAQQVASRGEGEAGAGGVVPEQGDAQTGIKNLGGNVALAQIAQRVGHGEHAGQLLPGFIPGQEKVVLVHVAQVEPFQFLDNLLESVAHCDCSSLFAVKRGQSPSPPAGPVGGPFYFNCGGEK
ncbi:hypothetical protein SDC9_195516 [bioreactor metagenome]|uniref:Uncharacterized protein n=1 Tax=bioreactor metagenome TaxID=1076179 RepID=A0A645IAS7_9ZZZZ